MCPSQKRLVNHQAQLVPDPLSDWQPVQLSKSWSHTVTRLETHNGACRYVQDSLELCQRGSWKTEQHGVAIVQSGGFITVLLSPLLLQLRTLAFLSLTDSAVIGEVAVFLEGGVGGVEPLPVSSAVPGIWDLQIIIIIIIISNELD